MKDLPARISSALDALEADLLNWKLNRARVEDAIREELETRERELKALRLRPEEEILIQTLLECLLCHCPKCGSPMSLVLRAK